jgi:hypothetical protein
VTLMHSAQPCAYHYQWLGTLHICSFTTGCFVLRIASCVAMQQFTLLQEVQVTLVEGRKMCSAAGSVTRVSNPL